MQKLIHHKMAFVSALPTVARPTTTPLATSSFTSSRKVTVAQTRRASVRMVADDNKKIPQGFTAFSEQLNGRAAMIGFVLALSTELITGKGIVGQVGSIFEVVNTAKAFMN